VSQNFFFGASWFIIIFFFIKVLNSGVSLKAISRAKEVDLDTGKIDGNN